MLRLSSLTRTAVFTLICLGAAALNSGHGASAGLASQRERSKFNFGEEKFIRLPVNEKAVHRPFQWPSETAFRETWESYRKARPIPLVRGHYVGIMAPRVVEKLGPSATWEEVLAALPEARSLEQSYSRRFDEISQRISEGATSAESVAAMERELEAIDYAEVRECPHALIAFSLRQEEWVGIDLLESGVCGSGMPLASLQSLRDPSRPLVVFAESSVVVGFKPASPYRDHPVKPDLWEDWTYSSTLLEQKRPLYRTVDESQPREPRSAEERAQVQQEQADLAESLKRALQEGPEEGLRGIREALDRGISPLNGILWKAAEFAEQQGDLDLALEVRSRFRPVGTCSMDTFPQTAARAYSDLCFLMGDLPCFLNLQVRIMGDAFDRLVYSTYGEASHETEANRMWDVGIDVNRFLRGLIVQFAVQGHQRVELSAWRLARSILESGQAPRMEGFLSHVAGDQQADPYNRFRAATVLAFLLFQPRQPKEFDPDAHRAAWEDVFNKLESVPLSEEARIWIDAVKRNNRE